MNELLDKVAREYGYKDWNDVEEKNAQVYIKRAQERTIAERDRTIAELKREIAVKFADDPIGLALWRMRYCLSSLRICITNPAYARYELRRFFGRIFAR
jgi:hypothetical protein